MTTFRAHAPAVREADVPISTGAQVARVHGTEGTDPAEAPFPGCPSDLPPVPAAV